MTFGWKEDLGNAPEADRPTCSSCADHTTLATWENGLKIVNIIINVSFILHGEYFRVMRLLIIVIIT